MNQTLRAQICDEPQPRSTLHPTRAWESVGQGGLPASNDTLPGAPRPTVIVTVVSFASELTITEPATFRYRWILTTARRTTRGLWNYLPESAGGQVRAEQEWHLIFPDAAMASLEVEGGKAGPVAAARVSLEESPAGHTFAIDAV